MGAVRTSRRAEKTLEAEVETAFELSNAQLQTLAAALSKALDRTVNLQQVVNPALIGGVLIRAGDVVVDGSVRQTEPVGRIVEILI